MHRVFAPISGLSPGHTLVIDDEEAMHALRVKRLEPGEAVEILDGQGTIAQARVLDALRKGKRAELHLEIVSIARAEPVRPMLHVRAATPKGPRVDDLVQQLAQVGAASWGPLDTLRGVVDPRPSKLDRLQRIAIEASKQCGRAWSLELVPGVGLAEALRASPETLVVVADGAGRDPGPVEAPVVRLLVGPEGGFAPQELDQARAAGAEILRFGPHAMRIETAAVVAAGVLMACSTWNTRGG